MSQQAQQLAEHDVVQELEEARRAKKAGHELEWMAKPATGQVKPDEVGGAQSVPVGGEADEVGGTQSVPLDSNRFDEAERTKEFISGEAGCKDEESDEWTMESDDVKIVREVHEQWCSKIDEKLRVFEEGNLKEGDAWLRSFM